MMRIRSEDWVILAAVVLGFHIIGTTLVRYYYGYHIAHYDSVGGLLQSMQTLDVYHDRGYMEGVESAWAKGPLSITQNMFAALFAPYIDPDPQGLQLYNTLAFGVAAMAMMVLLRRFGAGTPTILLGMAGIMLGDALYWWDLGAFDFRRDFGMYGLMCGMILLGGAYLAGPLRLGSEIRLGIAFGAVTGLTLICRDSAPLLMTGIAIVPLAALWAFSGFRDGWLPQLRKIAWPLIAFAPFAAIFFLKLEQLLSRVSNPLVMYGIDADGPNTLISNARRIPDAVFGLFSYPFNKAPWLSSIVVLLTFAGLGYACFRAWRTMKSREGEAGSAKIGATHEDAEKRARTRVLWFLLGTGVWTPFFLHLFFGMYLKWAADQPPIVAMAPYMLTLAGLTAVIAAALVFSTSQFSTRAGRGIALALFAIIALAIPARALTRITQYPPGTFEAHLDLARLSNLSGGPAVVAGLIDRTELMRVPAIQLLALQRGLPGLEQLKVRTHEGQTVDFQIGIPEDPALRASILDAMDTALRCDADYIVVSRDLASYARSGGRLLLYSHGAEMVGGIISDLTGAVVRTLDPEKTTVLLDNRQRATCLGRQ
jgi:hypothetical protein